MATEPYPYFYFKEKDPTVMPYLHKEFTEILSCLQREGLEPALLSFYRRVVFNMDFDLVIEDS
jgi:hypothetical protein